jgi:hypothetical protein
VIDAFKPVIDAAREFALADDAHNDGLYHLAGPNPDEHERTQLARAAAEQLADYAGNNVEAACHHPA